MNFFSPRRRVWVIVRTLGVVVVGRGQEDRRHAESVESTCLEFWGKGEFSDFVQKAGINHGAVIQGSMETCHWSIFNGIVVDAPSCVIPRPENLLFF